MSQQNRFLIGILIAVLIAIIGYAVLIQPDQRSVGQKIGDAVDELPNGVGKAARQLEDRTPGEKIGDAVQDAGDKVGEKIKENTSRD